MLKVAKLRKNKINWIKVSYTLQSLCIEDVKEEFVYHRSTSRSRRHELRPPVENYYQSFKQKYWQVEILCISMQCQQSTQQQDIQLLIHSTKNSVLYWTIHQLLAQKPCMIFQKTYCLPLMNVWVVIQPLLKMILSNKEVKSEKLWISFVD